MSYWGNKSADSDYAFDSVGAYIYLIKERMFEDIEKVIAKSFPEQSIIASLKCLRLIAGEFPQCVSVNFRKKEFRKARDLFEVWYHLVEDKLPLEYRDDIRSTAIEEFELFEKNVIGTS